MSLPPQRVQYVNPLLKERLRFGTGFPRISPEHWLADFREADFRPEMCSRILKDNAARLFALVP